MKKICIVLSLILVTTLFYGCSAAKEESGKKELEQVTFVLDWTPNTNHTGLYVAMEKGYFKEAGIEVEVVQPPEDGAEVLVASKRAQFGVSFQDALAPALVGENALPIQAVAAIVQHNTSGIISRKGEGAETPKGLEGKKYATWNGPIELETVKEVMEADGGDYNKLQMIPSTVTDEVSALKTKSVDALWIFYAWAGVKTEMEGLETDFFAFADIDPVFDYYTPIVIANNQYLQENPESTKAFMAALTKGYEYAMENPEESATILCKYAPELDAELVKKSQEYLADKYKADAKKWGYIDGERWNAFHRWLNEHELVNPQLEDNKGFTNEYLPE